MNFLSLFSPTGIMATLIIALSISNVVFIKLYGSVNRDYANFQAAVEAANREADAANRARDESARANTAEVAGIYSSYAADIDRSHRSRLDGLRQQLSACQTMPTLAPTTGKPDEPSTDTGPAATTSNPAGLVSVCEQLEADCAATTLQLVWLQEYTKRVCK